MALNNGVQVPMEFQTQNEAGETINHISFMDAIQAYERDPTIWKISFDYNGVSYPLNDYRRGSRK